MIRSSLTFARLYASIACASCPSISWIWARTLSASARFAETDGSAAAVLTDAKATATKSAVSSVRISGACLLLERITRSFRSNTRGNPVGARSVTSGGTLAAFSDGCNAQLSQKRRHLPNPYEAQTTRTDTPKLLRSAPRESAFDERCGAFRCRFHGLAAARVRSGRARGRRDRTATSQAAGLQARSGSLEERAAAATLELYSLEAQLGRARTELADIDARRATLARERASARTQLAVARQALLASQSELSDLARALYQQSGSDPLAVVLGAKSLDEASPASTASAAPPARTTGSSSRRATARARLAGAHRARLAERDAELDGSPPPRRRARASLAATAAAAPRAHRRAAPAAGPERGAHRRDRGPGTDGRDADDGARGRVAAARARARRDRGADRHAVRRAHAHRQRHRLHDPRAAPRPGSRPRPASSPSTRP